MPIYIWTPVMQRILLFSWGHQEDPRKPPQRYVPGATVYIRTKISPLHPIVSGFWHYIRCDPVGIRILAHTLKKKREKSLISISFTFYSVHVGSTTNRIKLLIMPT